MKTIVYISESGTISRVLTDTAGAQVLVLDANVRGRDDEEVVMVDGVEYALDSMHQALPRHDSATVAQVYASVVHELHRGAGMEPKQLATTLSEGLSLDFCASGSGECSCAKFGDDPTRCERGLEVAILKEQATTFQYNFDNLAIGTSTEWQGNITVPVVSRPGGLADAAWSQFAGQVCQLLNSR